MKMTLMKMLLIIFFSFIVGCSTMQKNDWYLEPLEPIEPYKPEQFYDFDYYLDKEIYIYG